MLVAGIKERAIHGTLEWSFFVFTLPHALCELDLSGVHISADNSRQPVPDYCFDNYGMLRHTFDYFVHNYPRPVLVFMYKYATLGSKCLAPRNIMHTTARVRRLS
jgi:hypothetical protein